MRRCVEAAAYGIVFTLAVLGMLVVWPVCLIGRGARYVAMCDWLLLQLVGRVIRADQA